MAPAPLSQTPPEPQASKAGSDNSSIATRIFTFQDHLDEIQELRERKSLLGGRLSRPIKEYRKEDIKMHPPRAGMWDNPDDAYQTMYLFLERKYWDGELRAWESLLARIQRRWERSNDAAGGTIPPPPPVRDMDPLELHTLYLDLVREKVEAGAEHGARDPFSGGWLFGDYKLLVEHSQAMERLVEEMRRERGLTKQAATEEEEGHGGTRESLASASHSGAKKAKILQGDDLKDAASPAGPASKKTRTKKPMKSASRKRKKIGGAELQKDTTSQAGPALKKTRIQNKNTSAPPRSKRARDDNLGDDNTQQASASTKTRRGKSKAPAPKKQSMRGASTKGSTSTSAQRHSRRKAGLKPENGGL
ncbi:hypothetical protein N0V82_009548 [Gnomoniopsis sp. IMI 355080]|nr:hypothetical protein N0V82_009548 [Gnomoniopsis sp. IMI 355080]